MRLSACLFSLAALVPALALVPTVAAASPGAGVTVRLSYEQQPGPQNCPTEAEFRTLVAVRLGYDPFRDDAITELAVKISGTAKAAKASMRLSLRSANSSDAARTRTLADTRCSALMEALASTVAIALDPTAMPTNPTSKPETTPEIAKPEEPKPEPKKPEEPKPEPKKPEEPKPQPTPREEVGVPWNLSVTGAGTATFGRAPAFLLGGRLGVRVDHGPLRLALEGGGGTLTAPVTFADHRGAPQVEASLLSGNLLACGVFPLLGAQAHFATCAVGSLGSLQVRARNVDAPRLRTPIAAAAAGRAQFEVGLLFAHDAGRRTPVLGLLAGAELGANVVRTNLIVNGEIVWTAPILQGEFSFGLFGTLP